MIPLEHNKKVYEQAQEKQRQMRTRGWCLNNLCKISSKTYSYYGKNRSTVIMDYVRKLKETITETNKLLTA